MFWDKKNETLKERDLKKIQKKRLKHIVEYCYRNSSFYKKKFKEANLKPGDIHELKDIEKIPYTSKQDLRDNYPLGLLSVPKDKIVRYHASSGTTGKPIVVAYTKQDINLWADLMARVLTSTGITKKDTIQLIYNYAFFTGGLGFHYGAERIGAGVIPSGVGNSKKQLMTLEDLAVTAFSSTPSYALYLAEYGRSQGIDTSKFHLRVGVFGAEPWSDNMRNKIEEAFGIKAYDNYGLSEMCGPGVAVECEEQNGMHVWADHFLPEVIDPKTGEPIGEEGKGELVFTTLTKEGMPMLRYRTRDIAVLHGYDNCACGRRHPKISKIMGRSDDMLIIRGVNVFPSQVEHVLMKFPEAKEHYQIVVDREGVLDILEVNIEITEEIFGGDVKELVKLKNDIEEELKSILDIKAKVNFVESGSIPRSEGKAKRILDLRKKL